MPRLLIIFVRVLTPYICAFGILTSVAAQGQDVFKQYHDRMILAISDNRIDYLKALLKTPYIDINDPAYPVSYLAYAATVDRPVIAQVLLDSGADIKWSNASGYNLLHLAAQNAKTSQILAILIAALTKATGSTSSQEFKRILNMRTSVELWTPLMGAYQGHYNAVEEDRILCVTQQLIEAGADPNLRDYHGTTVLRFAESHNLTKIITYLTQHGAHT
jgi:ankyrin repeat protein